MASPGLAAATAAEIVAAHPLAPDGSTQRSAALAVMLPANRTAAARNATRLLLRPSAWLSDWCWITCASAQKAASVDRRPRSSRSNRWCPRGLDGARILHDGPDAPSRVPYAPFETIRCQRRR